MAAEQSCTQYSVTGAGNALSVLPHTTITRDELKRVKASRALGSEQIIAYLIQKGEYSPETENTFVPSLCNRIDQNTAGIVIAAKNAPALRVMNQKIKDRELTKKYLCATEGYPPQSEGKLGNFIEKDSENNKVTVYNKRRNENSLTAITKYKVFDY